MKYSLLARYIRMMFWGIRLYEGDEGGGGGGADDAPTVQAQIDAAVAKAVSEATGGLQTKNATLIEEKRLLAEAAKSFEGLDPKKIKIMMTHFDNDEEAKLLAEGKIDEVIDMRTSKLLATAAGENTVLQENLTKSDERGNRYEDLYKTGRIENSLRMEAEAAGVLPEAIEDIVLRGKYIFSVDETNEIVAIDGEKKTLMTADGKNVLSTKSFIEDLKESAKHYWPSSTGAGFRPPKGPGGKVTDIRARMAAAADAGDQALYQELRRELKKSG